VTVVARDAGERPDLERTALGGLRSAVQTREKCVDGLALCFRRGIAQPVAQLRRVLEYATTVGVTRAADDPSDLQVEHRVAGLDEDGAAKDVIVCLTHRVGPWPRRLGHEGRGAAIVGAEQRLTARFTRGREDVSREGVDVGKGSQPTRSSNLDQASDPDLREARRGARRCVVSNSPELVHRCPLPQSYLYHGSFVRQSSPEPAESSEHAIATCELVTSSQRPFGPRSLGQALCRTLPTAERGVGFRRTSGTYRKSRTLQPRRGLRGTQAESR
jgi:hypothetical protein